MTITCWWYILNLATKPPLKLQNDISNQYFMSYGVTSSENNGNNTSTNVDVYVYIWYMCVYMSLTYRWAFFYSLLTFPPLLGAYLYEFEYIRVNVYIDDGISNRVVVNREYLKQAARYDKIDIHLRIMIHTYIHKCTN